MSGAYCYTWGGHIKVKPLEWYYASPDEQAALRVFMRNIDLLLKERRRDVAKARRSDRIEAGDRRILEFPPSTSPGTVAKVLKAEGWYSPKTTTYYIEYRIRRLRARVRRENIRTQDQNSSILAPCAAKAPSTRRLKPPDLEQPADVAAVMEFKDDFFGRGKDVVGVFCRRDLFVERAEDVLDAELSTSVADDMQEGKFHLALLLLKAAIVMDEVEEGFASVTDQRGEVEGDAEKFKGR